MSTALTSAEARQFISPFKGRARERVYLCILRAGGNGISDEGIADRLMMSLNTVRPRRVELRDAGLIEEHTTHEAVLDSGCKAVLWVADKSRGYEGGWFTARKAAQEREKRLEAEVVRAARAFAKNPTVNNQYALHNAAGKLTP